MPLNVGESINWMAESILKAPLIDTAMKNPMYSAMLITFIIVLIVMFIFRDADFEDSLLVMGLRTGIWVFVLLLGAMYLQNKVLLSTCDDVSRDRAYGGLFSSRDMPVFEDVAVPVVINTDFSQV